MAEDGKRRAEERRSLRAEGGGQRESRYGLAMLRRYVIQ